MLAGNETQTAVEDFQQYDFDQYAVGATEEQYTNTRNDGWWAAILLGLLSYAPQTAPGAWLPPIRSVDFFILLMFFLRWPKATRLYGGFMFTHRVRPFTLLILALAVVVLFTTLINAAIGRSPFFVKDLYPFIVFVRMAVIASIMASFTFHERQIKQFSIGFLFVASMTVLLAFFQRFLPWTISGLIERLYAIEWSRVAIKTTGTGSRVVGTFGNSNAFSAYLVMLAAGSLAIAINIKGIIKLTAVAVFVSLAAAMLITTASRTGYIAFLGMSTVAMLLSFRGRARLSAMFFVILLVAMYAFLRFNIDELPLNPRMKNLIGGEAGAITESMQGRYKMWTESLRTARSSIFLGVGIAKQTYQLTDNGYIIMLLRTGIVGLTIYLLLLLRLSILGLKTFYMESRPLFRIMLLMGLVVLVNHMVFELTADFFWSIKYGSLFAACMGLGCAAASQTISDRNYWAYYDHYNLAGVDSSADGTSY